MCFVPERVAARRRARRGSVAPRLRVRQARRARLAGQPLGGPQDRRLHLDAAGRLTGGARAVRARQPALRAARRASPATPTTCAARSSAPSTATTGSPGSLESRVLVTRAPLPRDRPDQARRAGRPGHRSRRRRGGSPRPSCSTARWPADARMPSAMPTDAASATGCSPQSSETCASACHAADCDRLTPRRGRSSAGRSRRPRRRRKRRSSTTREIW